MVKIYYKFEHISYQFVIGALLAFIVAREYSLHVPSTKSHLPTYHVEGDRQFWRISPLALGHNPFLDIHLMRSGLTPEQCRAIIRAAEDVGRWEQYSDFGNSTKTEDMSIDFIRHWRGGTHSDTVGAPIDRFLQQLSLLISERFLFRSDADGKAITSSDGKHINVAQLVGTPFVIRDPFVIRYDVAKASVLQPHKDDADVSFVLLLSNPEDDFKGGATHFELLDRTLDVQQGDVLVFNGQLVHSTVPLEQGMRYVIAGFAYFSERFLDMKRRGTLETMPYHH